MVNALCPPRHLEPWPLVCGQGRAKAGLDLCPLLVSRNCSPFVESQSDQTHVTHVPLRSISGRLSRVNTGGNARRRRIVCKPMAWKTARFRAVQADPYGSTATIYTC